MKLYIVYACILHKLFAHRSKASIPWYICIFMYTYIYIFLHLFGHGLMLSGSKTLPVPMMIQINVAIWRQKRISYICEITYMGFGFPSHTLALHKPSVAYVNHIHHVYQLFHQELQAMAIISSNKKICLLLIGISEVIMKTQLFNYSTAILELNI